MEKILAAFPAFRGRNYQLYFSGQLISLIGTWLQMVVQGWLVLQLTNSAFWLGMVAAVSTLPMLPFSLFGGVIVDRFPKQKIILLTQISAMILAFTLGILTVFNLINVWEIMLLGFLLGMVNAVDTPARQSFVVEMVGKKDLASAISLNSGTFNAARVIGPGVAGFLIAIFGIGGAFIVNGLSYIAVIAAICFIRVEAIIHQVHPNPLRAIKEGVSYSVSHPIIRTLLLFIGVLSIFGWSFMAILPFVAQNTFRVGAEGLGYLYAASGIGAFAAAILISAISWKFHPLIFIVGGNSLFALSMLAFTFVREAAPAIPFLFLSGAGLLAQMTTINTVVQNLVEDRFRGRVMSLYVLMFAGLSPLGNFQMGFLTEHFGWPLAVRISAVAVFLFGLLLYLSRERIAQSHQKYKEQKSRILPS